MIMKNDILKPPVPLFVYIQCVNCSGYGTKGYARIQCPTCKGEGVLKVPAKEGEAKSEN